MSDKAARILKMLIKYLRAINCKYTLIEVIEVIIEFVNIKSSVSQNNK